MTWSVRSAPCGPVRALSASEYAELELEHDGGSSARAAPSNVTNPSVALAPTQSSGAKRLVTRVRNVPAIAVSLLRSDTTRMRHASNAALTPAPRAPLGRTARSPTPAHVGRTRRAPGVDAIGLSGRSLSARRRARPASPRVQAGRARSGYIHRLDCAW